jgi:hypothetical protein
VRVVFVCCGGMWTHHNCAHTTRRVQGKHGKVRIVGKLLKTSFLRQVCTGTNVQEFSKEEAKLEGMDPIVHRGSNYL